MTGAQPWAVQFEARAKWDAWAELKGMSKEEAMRRYVELIAAGESPPSTRRALRGQAGLPSMHPWSQRPAVRPTRLPLPAFADDPEWESNPALKDYKEEA